MIFKLRRKRVPPWDINSALPRKRRRNSLAQWVSALFCLMFIFTGSVWAAPFAYIPMHPFDTNGRLVALSNQQGQTLEFKHDDAGSLI